MLQIPSVMKCTETINHCPPVLLESALSVPHLEVPFHSDFSRIQGRRMITVCQGKAFLQIWLGFTLIYQRGFKVHCLQAAFLSNPELLGTEEFLHMHFFFDRGSPLSFPNCRLQNLKYLKNALYFSMMCQFSPAVIFQYSDALWGSQLTCKRIWVCVPRRI